mmetsp:Transcript_4656/g.11563  ORF Transcript_4656/g.11563 Transcript_4656/m.11563 type:complete len:207 (+) Transcript_4656:129-749(+)
MELTAHRCSYSASSSDTLCPSGERRTSTNSNTTSCDEGAFSWECVVGRSPPLTCEYRAGVLDCRRLGEPALAVLPALPGVPPVPARRTRIVSTLGPSLRRAGSCDSICAPTLPDRLNMSRRFGMADVASSGSRLGVRHSDHSRGGLVDFPRRVSRSSEGVRGRRCWRVGTGGRGAGLGDAACGASGGGRAGGSLEGASPSSSDRSK